MIPKWMQKSDFEILFKDSPEYFGVQNAKMFQEGAFVRFAVFNLDKPNGDVFFPIQHIHRIKKIVKTE